MALQSTCGLEVGASHHSQFAPSVRLSGCAQMHVIQPTGLTSSLLFVALYINHGELMVPCFTFFLTTAKLCASNTSVGTYATKDLLSPDGCAPCPRGTYASSDNLGAEDECHLCPAGTFNDRTGAVTVAGCALCPPHTFGARSGLTTSLCSGRCPAGKYRSAPGAQAASDCKDCPRGYTGGGGQCHSAASREVAAAKAGGASAAAAEAGDDGDPGSGGTEREEQQSAQGLSAVARSRSPEYNRLARELASHRD